MGTASHASPSTPRLPATLGISDISRLFGILAACACASCSGESEVGIFDVDVYDGDVECAADGRACVDAYGEEAVFETPAAFAFLTTETSAHHPDGLFLYFEVERGGGVVGRGELDIPLGDEGTTTFAYREDLRETEESEDREDREDREDEPVFVAVSATGVIEVPEEVRGEQCDCLDGRLELEFTDAAGHTIRFSRGRFGWEDRECIPRARFTVLPEEGIEVLPRHCGGTRYVSSSTGSTPPPPAERREYPSVPASSGGTTSCDASGGSSCDGGDAGCSGDGGGCEGDAGGGGCEGDTGGAGCAGDAGGSGCAGDAGGAGCAGDAGGSCRVGGRRLIGPRGPRQTGVLLALALGWILRPRRRG